MTTGAALIGTTGATAWAIGIANAVAGADYSPLYNLGAIGVVLGWLMWRVEPRMKSMEAAQDRATRANMLMLIAIPQVADGVKEQAQGISKEIDEAALARKGK